MQAPEDFTLVLSATAERLQNTSHQLSKFSTSLGSTIKLVGNYKCALTYLHYPKTYYNIDQTQLKLVALFKLDNSVKAMSGSEWRAFEAEHKKKVMLDLQSRFKIIISEVTEEYRKEEAVALYRFPGKVLVGNRTYDIAIPDALYRDENDLVNEINIQLDKMILTENSVRYGNHVPHMYSVKSRGTLGLRAGVIAEGGLVFPDFSTEIQKLLGFRKHFEFLDNAETLVPDLIIDKSKIYAMADFKSVFNYIRVYSNFVKPSFVNNRMEPLLQIAAVPTLAPFGEQIGVSFTPAHYLDVSVSEFNSIDVLLSFDGDNPIPLQNGEVILMLHVKKIY